MKDLIQAIQAIVNATGKDWHIVLTALAHFHVVNSHQVRQLENYFFELEDKQ